MEGHSQVRGFSRIQLVPAARLELALLDPQVLREFQLVASDLL